MAAALSTRVCASRTAAVSVQASSRTALPSKTAFTGTSLRGEVSKHGRGHRLITSAKVEFDLVGASYANALVDVAQSKGCLEAVHADLDGLQSLFQECPDITQLLFNPTVEAEKKAEIVKSISKEAGLNEYTINFINLLVDRNRFEAIEEIFLAFEEQYCKLTDTQVATLRSAVKLEQEQQFLIAKKLQELTGSKNIKLKPVTDESLIGGFIVEYGSVQMDLSIKGQLDKIAAELRGAAASAVSA